jgi:site-specific DNA recombinase
MKAEYRRQVARRTAEAMERKARAGHVTGGRVFGYDNLNVRPSGERSHVVLRINEGEAAIVLRIFPARFAG